VRASRGVGDRHAARGLGHRREDLGEPEASLLAHGTAGDVDPGEAQHEGLHGFGGTADRCGRMSEELAAARELGLARAVGQETEVADADEAVGHDMEQEAADELLGAERHHLDAIAVGVVLPAEADEAVVEAEEPVVGDRDAMGVAPEVVEHLRGAGEGPLGVHDPVGLPELSEPRREGRRLGEGREGAGEAELAVREGAPERVEVLGAEDGGESADGEEEPGRRGDPAGAIGGQGAPGDDAMQVEVLGEILSPGVQDRRAAEVAAEMAGIAGEGGEGVGDGVEEQGVERTGIALGERVEGVRQGKDQMEVLDGQQFGAAGVEPPFLGERLALGTVTVAAGVVADLDGAAGVARVAMSTEGGGAARLDGLHGAALSASQRMSLPIGRSVGAEDIGELHRGTSSRAPRLCGRRRRAHGLLDAGWLGQIQGRVRPREALLARWK
jgi:hypothetical protein